MAAEQKSSETWLVAAWPGIGNVAVGAAAYLLEQLEATLIHELPADDLFEVTQVDVKGGLAKPASRPRQMVFQWNDPAGRRDLLILLSEAQPSTGGMTLCRRVLDVAAQHNVKRVFTFAAMATQLHPSAKPRVFGVATRRALLAAMREFEVEILDQGQVGGLNGVLLAAAIERGLPGMCLMGELPFFAGGIQNPRASQAVLEVFTKYGGIDIDFTRIREAGAAVEKVLLDLLAKMQQAAREQADEAGAFEPTDIEGPATEEEDKPAKPRLDPRAIAHIEALFDQAAQDRDKAFQLKAELDRLGAFADYEDRFLDLFKRAE